MDVYNRQLGLNFQFDQNEREQFGFWHQRRCWLDGRPPWCRLKYLSNYKMDWNGIWYRHRLSQEDESWWFWRSSEFSPSATMKFKFFCFQCDVFQLFDGLIWRLEFLCSAISGQNLILSSTLVYYYEISLKLMTFPSASAVEPANANVRNTLELNQFIN